MMFESLESRRLMSVTFDGGTGVVTVLGRDDLASYDTITARVGGGRFVVNDNGSVHSFAAPQVKKIVVRMRAGDGTVALDPTVTIPSDITTATTQSSDVVVRGGSGPDTVRVIGPNGAVVRGGAGNDTFLVYGFAVDLYGDAGNDAFRSFGSTRGSNYHGGTGNDALDYSEGSSASSPGEPGLLIRNGTATEYYRGTGIPPEPRTEGYADSYDGMDTFVGTAGDDFIYGTAGANYIDARGGNDYVRGGGGNDVLVGGPGADALYGDDGDDVFYTRDGTKDFLSGGAGYDRRRADAIDVLNSVEGTV